MTLMTDELILVGTPEWEDFILEAEVVTTLESQDGPNVVTAMVLRGTPDGDAGCTLYASAYVQDPAPSPTLTVNPEMAALLRKMGAVEDYTGEVLDIRGTFLEGVKPGAMHSLKFAEAHPSIGSAVLRLAALSHANATGRLLGELDIPAGLGMLKCLTVESGAE